MALSPLDAKATRIEYYATVGEPLCEFNYVPYGLGYCDIAVGSSKEVPYGERTAVDKAKSSPKQEIITSCILLNNIRNKKFSRREIERGTKHETCFSRKKLHDRACIWVVITEHVAIRVFIFGNRSSSDSVLHISDIP